MNLLLITHTIVSFLLVVSILLQAGESGMFSTGGMMSGGENFHTRRGLEKVLFYATFVLLAIFVVLNIFLLRA